MSKITFFLEPVHNGIVAYCSDACGYRRKFKSPVQLNDIQKWLFIHRAVEHKTEKADAK